MGALFAAGWLAAPAPHRTICRTLAPLARADRPRRRDRDRADGLPARSVRPRHRGLGAAGRRGSPVLAAAPLAPAPRAALARHPAGVLSRTPLGNGVTCADGRRAAPAPSARWRWATPASSAGRRRCSCSGRARGAAAREGVLWGLLLCGFGVAVCRGRSPRSSRASRGSATCSRCASTGGSPSRRRRSPRSSSSAMPRDVRERRATPAAPAVLAALLLGGCGVRALPSPPRPAPRGRRPRLPDGAARGRPRRPGTLGGSSLSPRARAPALVRRGTDAALRRGAALPVVRVQPPVLAGASLPRDSPLLRFLHAQQGTFRVTGEGATLFPSTNVFARLEDIRTHDAVERRDYMAFLDATCGYPYDDYFKKIRNVDAPALDFLNVRYVLGAIRGTRRRARGGAPSTPARTARSSRIRASCRAPSPHRASASSRRRPPRPWPVRDAAAAFGPAFAQITATRRLERARLRARGRGRREAANPRVDGLRSTPSRRTRRPSRRASPGARPDGSVVLSLVQDGGWSARDVDGAARHAPSRTDPSSLAECRPAPPADRLALLSSRHSARRGDLARDAPGLLGIGRRPTSGGEDGPREPSRLPVLGSVRRRCRRTSIARPRAIRRSTGSRTCARAEPARRSFRACSSSGAATDSSSARSRGWRAWARSRPSTPTPAVVERARPAAPSGAASPRSPTPCSIRTRRRCPTGPWDAVIVHDTLHHVAAPRGASTGAVHEILAPRGRVVFVEYVGPNRFQYPAERAELVQRYFRLLPRRLRTDRQRPGIRLAPRARSTRRPSRASSPFEAARSEDLLALARRCFVAEAEYSGAAEACSIRSSPGSRAASARRRRGGAICSGPLRRRGAPRVARAASRTTSPSSSAAAGRTRPAMT